MTFMSTASTVASSSLPDAGAMAGRRFYDNATGTWMVKVFPGEFYVSRQSDEVLVTVLGSCVSACIRDPIRGVGGMNHFMLPHDSTGRWGDDQKSTRFGNFAMEQLINELIKAGCVRERMEIKLFGGGNVTDTSNAVGTDNAEFVLSYLKAEGLRHAVADLGGTQPRRIHYYPATGRAVRRLLGSTDKYAVTRDEKEYGRRLQVQPTHGDIELFGDP
jgi:chemotaxis protein CheD